MIHLEIERKFLVIEDAWRVYPGKVYKQGYLCTSPERTVRVRVVGDKGFLTIKGESTGISRVEYEYNIPGSDATALLALSEYPLIEKTRHILPFDQHTWEVDVFAGLNTGLILAEIELSSEDEAFALPPWVGQEVTHDPRYYNAYLAKFPYCQW